MESRDISFVIQGLVDRDITPLAMRNIRRFFPGAEIVLATYIGTDTTALDYDLTALVEDQGFHFHKDFPQAKPNNINRQIQTTLAGLKAATRPYAFKLRTDFILNGSGFLNYFNLFPKSDSDCRIFGHKLLSCVFFARDPRRKRSFAFHPSDIAFFGFRADLINLFDVPFMTREESVFYKVKDRHYCKYVPEQHLWVNCLRRNGKDIRFEHQRDTSPKNIEDTEKYAVSNFIHLDWEQFNLTPPGRLTTFVDNTLDNIITHIEWQRLYRRYLDHALVVPEKDFLRDFISKKTRRLRLCRFIAKICVILLIGRPLKQFRKNIREKILRRLMKNICLPDNFIQKEPTRFKWTAPPDI